jgi:hypothetical protein
MDHNAQSRVVAFTDPTVLFGGSRSRRSPTIAGSGVGAKTSIVGAALISGRLWCSRPRAEAVTSGALRVPEEGVFAPKDPGPVGHSPSTPGVDRSPRRVAIQRDIERGSARPLDAPALTRIFERSVDRIRTGAHGSG